MNDAAKTDRSLHVLVVPSLFPTSVSPVDGVYVRDQVQMLHRAGVRVAVLYPELRSWRTISRKPWANWFQTRSYCEGGVETSRIHAWNIPRLKLGTRIWLEMVMRLAKTYTKVHGKPDLCHAHNCHWAGLSARRIKEEYGIPYVITEHSSAYGRGLLTSWQAKDARDALVEADGILVVSDSLKQFFSPMRLAKRSRRSAMLWILNSSISQPIDLELQLFAFSLWHIWFDTKGLMI